MTAQRKDTKRFGKWKNKAEKKEYTIPFEGIYLHYNDIEASDSVEDIISSDTSSVQKVFHNGQLIIINNNKIYNILGHEITEKY